MAYNYQGQCCGRPHVASWAEVGVTLTSELLAGNEDPRPGVSGLLRRALAVLPEGVGQVKLRADAGYFARWSWPLPRTGRASASRSAPSTSLRCGAPWPGSQRPGSRTKLRPTRR